MSTSVKSEASSRARLAYSFRAFRSRAISANASRQAASSSGGSTMAASLMRGQDDPRRGLLPVNIESGNPLPASGILLTRIAQVTHLFDASFV